jgi:hypothetical protein
MRRLLDGRWLDEPLPRDYWEKLNSKRVIQLRNEVKQGTVELAEPEAAQLAKVDARFAKALASQWQRWKGRVQDSLDVEHQFAKRRHEQDRTALKKALEEGAAQNGDERLKNSARRILDGRTQLYALTPTPDSAARALAAGKPGMRAFFGYPDSNPLRVGLVAGHVLDDAAADYDWDDVTNNSRVVFDAPNSAGFRTVAGGKIFVVEPSRIDAINALRRELGIQGRHDPVKQVLKHESQHEVDRIYSQDVKRIGNERAVSRDAALALAEYQTEFRAYAAQEPEWLWTPLTRAEEQTLERLGLSFTRAQQPPPRADPEANGFTDWVQLKIFLHIYMRYPNIKKEWDKTTLVRKRPTDETEENRWFRDAVLQTRGGLDRVSANPTNSPRVERFWPALQKASTRDDPHLSSNAMSALVTALKELDDNDRAALQRNAYYHRQKIPGWLRATVDALLSDPGADVTPILEAEEAERAEASRQREEQRQRTAGLRADRQRGDPPLALDLEEANITTWEEMEQLLERVTTKDGNSSLEDVRVTEPLTFSRTNYPQPSAAVWNSFLAEVSPFVALWPALDERRAD